MIQFAIDLESGLIVSRLDSEYLWPIMNYPEQGYTLQKVNIFEVAGIVKLKYTRKIPLTLKNKHRIIWGLKPIKKRKK